MATGEVNVLNRVYRITTRMAIRQQQIQTSFHLRDVGVPLTTAEDAFNSAEGWLNTIFRPAVSSSVSILRLEAERLNDREYYAEDFSAVTGALSIPQNNTMFATAVSLKSTSRARFANGRMFWPVAEQNGTDGIGGGNLAALLAAAAAMQSRYVGATLFDQFELVVVGAGVPAGAGTPAGPPRWTSVATVRVNPILTALRSRKVGVGR